MKDERNGDQVLPTDDGSSRLSGAAAVDRAGARSLAADRSRSTSPTSARRGVADRLEFALAAAIGCMALGALAHVALMKRHCTTPSSTLVTAGDSYRTAPQSSSASFGGYACSGRSTSRRAPPDDQSRRAAGSVATARAAKESNAISNEIQRAPWARSTPPCSWLRTTRCFASCS